MWDFYLPFTNGLKWLKLFKFKSRPLLPPFALHTDRPPPHTHISSCHLPIPCSGSKQLCSQDVAVYSITTDVYGYLELQSSVQRETNYDILCIWSQNRKQLFTFRLLWRNGNHGYFRRRVHGFQLTFKCSLNPHFWFSFCYEDTINMITPKYHMKYFGK